MKCPGCDTEVKDLIEKPVENNNVTWSNAGASVISGTMDFQPNPTQQTFKCCNEKCWVTRIEVDWNHG